MTDHLYSRYSVIECVVIGHAQYGLMVESLSGERGYVENEFISDTPTPSRSLPKIGDHLFGVVLGYTGDGRLRLCTQASYVELIQSTADVKKALDVWSTVRRADRDYVKTIEALSGSADMLSVLHWALRRRPSSDHDVAVRALLNMPSGLQLEFMDELIQDVVDENHADTARDVIASIDSRLVGPVLRHSIEVLLSCPAGLKLEHYLRLAELLRQLSAAQPLQMVVSAMMSSDDPVVRAAGMEFQAS